MIMTFGVCLKLPKFLCLTTQLSNISDQRLKIIKLKVLVFNNQLLAFMLNFLSEGHT